MTDTETIPENIRWSPNVIPGAPAFGECVHLCEHKRLKVIGRGPDDMRYTLAQCTAPACTAVPEVQCRSWFTERQSPWGKFLTVWVGEKR